MNPHAKEAWFVHYLDEKDYVNDVWHDTGLWVEVRGLGLVICTISISTGHGVAMPGLESWMRMTAHCRLTEQKIIIGIPLISPRNPFRQPRKT